MEIHQLTLLVSNQDLVHFSSSILKSNKEIQDLQFSIQPDGLLFSGKYELMFRIPFHTHWELAIAEGKIAARLVKINALGVPVGVLRSYLLRWLVSASAENKSLLLQKDTLLIDIDQLLSEEGIVLKSNLAEVTCKEGYMLISAGNSKT